MRKLVLLIALLLALPALADTVRLGERYYRIELPAQPKGAPLILALHGGDGNPDQFAAASGLARAATRAGYAVAFTIEGGAHHWPGGRKARLAEGKTQEIDANAEILRFFLLHP
ncbi:hypothetical protein [Tabrizicola soli]|uniref:Dienelactone hydrolase domain-containing protein n=1 Tax=Tabrizicola soli TaxID=2185115 RepID=A0ABV7DXZ0_9RHOB|nr:hypothetical protein [Tabrizicola soli]